MSMRTPFAFMLIALALLASPALHAQKAAEVVMLTGRATAATPDGAIRQLAKGSAVSTGEVVNTGPNSFANLKFTDGGLTLLRPNSRFQIEEYRHRPAPATPATPATPAARTERAPAAPGAVVDGSRAFFRLIKGGFRTVTGAIGRLDQAEYRITTPAATIGVRGTDYVVVLCTGPCVTDPAIAGSVLPGVSPEGGVVIGVISGSIFVQNEAGGSVELGQDQYLFVLPDGTLVSLPTEPRFLRVDPIPNPESCQ